MGSGMTYKGLTIRIGGDTAPLQRAIKEVSTAASTMQSQLRRVNAGLRFDPANTALLAAKMGQLAEKSVLAGMKASILKQHLKEIPKSAIEAATEDTGKLGARAALAYEKYNKLNDEIAALRRKLAMEEYGLDADASEKEIKKAVKKYKEFEEQCRETHTVANKKLAELQAQWQKVEAELEDARDAIRFSDMRIELEKLEAESRQAAAEFTDLKEKLRMLDGSPGLKKARTDVEFLGNAADDTKADIEQLDAAVREGGRDAATSATKYLRLMERHEQLGDKANALRAQLRALEAQLGGEVAPTSLASANAEFQKAKSNLAELKYQADAARGRVEALEMEMRLLDGDNSSLAVADLKKLESELIEARGDAERLEASLNQAEKEYQAAGTVREISKVQMELRQTAGEARAVSSAMNGMSAKNWYIIRSVGTVLMSTITPALTMGIQKITDASETLDAAWRDMRKTVNGTEDDFQHLKDAAIEFSKTHVTTADQILEIEAMGGQLGIVVEDLEAFATTVANLDIATNMESDQISEDLGKLANILGMSVDDYDNFGDALVRLGNNEAALEGDIMKITTRYAGMGKIVGMSADQILAWATAATATGQKAEAAGSSMQRFVSNMETAVNGSEEELAKWAKVAGMSGEEFKKSFGQDASGTMYKFIEGLAGIQKSGGSVNQTLMELGITGVRDKQLLEGLAQQMVNATDDNNVLKDSLEMSSNAWNGISDKWGQAGDAMNEAEKKSQGFSGSMGKLRNTITSLASSAGNSLVPWIDRITVMLGGLQDVYASLPEGTKQAINGIGAVVAAMGPVMMIVGAAGQGLTSFKKNLAENGAAALNEAQAIKIVTAQREIDIATLQRDMEIKRADAAATEQLTAAEIASAREAAIGYQKTINDQEKAIKKTKALAGATKLLKGFAVTAGISLAAAAIGFLISKYVEAKKHAELLTKSHEKMEGLFKKFDASNEEEELEKVTISLKEVRQASEDAAQANIDLADGFEEAMAELHGNFGNLDDVIERIQTISKNIDKSGTATKEQVNDLKTAVNQLNELTGTNWIVDDTGKILDQSKAMSELVGSYESLIDAYNQVHGTNLTLDENGDWDTSVASLQDLVDAVNELNGTDFVIDENGSIVSASGEFDDLAVEIRDVITATDELRESQDRLWARDVYKEWADEAGKNAMDQKAKLEEVTKSYEEAEKDRQRILDRYGGDEKLARTHSDYIIAADAASDYKKELDSLAESQAKNAELQKMWNEDAAAFDAPTDSIEGVLTKYRDIGTELSELHVSAGDMADSMKALGITFDDVADLSSEDVEKIADGWDGKMMSLVKNLQDAGVELDETTIKMAELADQSGLSAPKISDMWAAFGGDVERVQEAINVLNETDIDPKEVEFKDNTMVVKGHISDLDRQKIEDKGFKVDDGGSISSSKAEVSDLNSSLNGIDGKTSTIGVAINGLSSLQTMMTYLATFKASYAGKQLATSVKANKGGSATGAAIVKNARGRVLDGRVVTRPTMTNIGLVGEAGAEWVDNHSVIPLTNRKYMVPIAREIAAGLNTYNTGRNVNVSVSLNYSAGADANQMATDLTRALRRKILMEG